MRRQPFSDRLTALGIAMSMHIALGCALLLAARSGVAGITAADRDAGKPIAIHILAPGRTSVTRTMTNDGRAETAGTSRTVVTTPRVGATAVAAEAGSAAPPAGAENHLAAPAQAQTASVDAHAAQNLPSEEVLAFRTRLEEHLARYRLYPVGAKDTGSQGTVVLHFIMNRDGNVRRAWIEVSSGVPAIDDEALDAVHRAVPLPPLPPDFPDTLDVRVPVSFTLS